MPVATPTHAPIFTPQILTSYVRFYEVFGITPFQGFADKCANCGGRIQTGYHGASDMRSWSHLYPAPFEGVKICDPQQARAAQQGRQPSHA